MKKVSIIIPVYNDEKYIGQCLQSIINQTFSNLEIIVINDGSKDLTDSICKEFVQKDNRIKYICKENKGVSNTRNVGLENCTGDYIMFVDSDDWLEINCIDAMMKNIEENDILQCNNYLCVDDEKKVRKYANKVMHFNSTQKDDLILNVVNPEKFEKINGYYGEFRTIWGKLYKKEIINKNRFIENMKFYEDGEFYINVLSQGVSLKIIDEPLYNYRFNIKGCTKSYRKNMMEESKIVMEKLNDALESYSGLYNNVVVDMYCLNLNNLLRKEKFKYKEIKEVCKYFYLPIKSARIDYQGMKLKRKLLIRALKIKWFYLIYVLCNLKKVGE